VPAPQAGFRCPIADCRVFRFAIAGYSVFRCEFVPSLTTLPQVLKALLSSLSDPFDALLCALAQALDALLRSLA
jgi:hypothetical protein